MNQIDIYRITAFKCEPSIMRITHRDNNTTVTIKIDFTESGIRDQSVNITLSDEHYQLLKDVIISGKEKCVKIGEKII